LVWFDASAERAASVREPKRQGQTRPCEGVYGLGYILYEIGSVSQNDI
jgi:hypothetical protein